MPRREARAAFKHLMAAKAQRRTELLGLLSRNGLFIDETDARIQALNDWFDDNVEGDGVAGRLDNVWYAVVNDIFLYLGDVAIRNNSLLEWRMYEWGSSRTTPPYQRPVLMGFDVPNKKYNLDIGMRVAVRGQRKVMGERLRPGEFVQLTNFEPAL
jgi:hypothetical protein